MQTAFCERWGSNLFSLRGAVLPPPSDCHSFNEELTYLRGMIPEQSIRLLDVALKWKSRKAQFYIICVCAHVRVCVVDAFLV